MTATFIKKQLTNMLNARNAQTPEIWQENGFTFAEIFYTSQSNYKTFAVVCLCENGDVEKDTGRGWVKIGNIND